MAVDGVAPAVTLPSVFTTPVTDVPTDTAAVPEVATASIGDQVRLEATQLNALRAEAAGWAALGAQIGDQALVSAATALVGQIDQAIGALRTADATALATALSSETTVIAGLETIASQHPVAATAPSVATTALDAASQALSQNILQNRSDLTSYRETAMADNRPDVARRIAAMITRLDSALTLLVQSQDRTGAIAKATTLTQSVIAEFDGVAEQWSLPIGRAYAQSASPSALTPGVAPSALTPGVTPSTVAALPGTPSLDGLDTSALPVSPQVPTAVTPQTDPLLAAANETERTDAAREAQEAEEAKKPGFFRALLEVLELLARFFFPFVNLLCALFRIIKIGYKLLTGRKVDWVQEGIRLVADLASVALGVMFPGAGGLMSMALKAVGPLGNAGANVMFNKSQLFGGINEFFDKAEVESPFRNLISGNRRTADWVRTSYDTGRSQVTGTQPALGNAGVDYAPVAVPLST